MIQDVNLLLVPFLFPEISYFERRPGDALQGVGHEDDESARLIKLFQMAIKPDKEFVDAFQIRRGKYLEPGNFDFNLVS